MKAPTSRLFLLLAVLILPLRAADVALPQAKTKFATADKELNKVYAEAKAALSTEEFTELQQSQRSWITYSAELAGQRASYDANADAPAEELEARTLEWRTELTESRTSLIRGLLKAGSFAHEWEGVWTDGEGGYLAILQNEKGKFAFALEVVRGPTYHLGFLNGTADWNGATARFTTRSEGEENETWITFLQRGRKMEVIGENTSGFHGVRAYFDGNYVRVAELTEKDRIAILEPER